MPFFFALSALACHTAPACSACPTSLKAALRHELIRPLAPGRLVQKLCRLPKPNKISPFCPRTGRLLSPWLPRLANRMLDSANVTAFFPSQKFDLKVKLIVRLSVFLQTVFINKESPFQINIFSFHRQHLACLLSNLKNNKLYFHQCRKGLDREKIF